MLMYTNIPKIITIIPRMYAKFSYIKRKAAAMYVINTLSFLPDDGNDGNDDDDGNDGNEEVSIFILYYYYYI